MGCPTVSWRCRREAAERGGAAFAPPEATNTIALQRNVGELERFWGQLALQNAAPKKRLSTLLSQSNT